MSAYNVIITRDTTESVVIEVDAANEKEAEEMAYNYIWHTENVVKWEGDDTVNGEVYTTGIERI